MDLSLEIIEGEKLCADLEEIGNQIAFAWRDDTSIAFLDKYNALCTQLSHSVQKLGEL